MLFQKVMPQLLLTAMLLIFSVAAVFLCVDKSYAAENDTAGKVFYAEGQDIYI